MALAQEHPDGHLHFIHRQRYASADFSGLDAMLAHFLEAVQWRSTGRTIDAACLAVAGPVNPQGTHAQITNLPWSIDACACARLIDCPRTILINDFEAAATGIATTPAHDLVCLQIGKPLACGIRLVIGAGTGLGMALALPRPESVCGWQIIPGEGGHIGFTAQSALGLRLAQKLIDTHGRATWEQVLSGRGLSTLHHLLTGEDCPPEHITARARAADPKALTTVDAFARFYGDYAGDMALLCLARAGIFLAGGLAPALLPALQSDAFKASFCAKAEHAHLMSDFPLHVVTDPALGLRGAAYRAMADI
jgi:glucokinase